MIFTRAMLNTHRVQHQYDTLRNGCETKCPLFSLSFFKKRFDALHPHINGVLTMNYSENELFVEFKLGKIEFCLKR